MGGLTTSAWGRSAKPTEPWRNIHADGFASGCASNTKSGQVGPRVFPCKLCIRSLAWFDLLRGPPVFRGRTRESFLRELDALTAPVQFDKRGCGNVAW